MSATTGIGNITASFNTTTGVLTLTSAGNTATVAQFNTALQSVTYFNSSENPTGGARTVNFVVNDSALNSNAIASTITVVPVNDAPV